MSDIPYNNYEIRRTKEFTKWWNKQTQKTKDRIDARLDFVSIGHFGDHKRFEGIIEFRWINGVRVYCFDYRKFLIIALIGGNKNGQSKDINKAKKIKEEYLNGTRTVF